jgi:hypothetical protein
MSHRYTEVTIRGCRTATDAATEHADLERRCPRELAAGSGTEMALASLFGAWRVRGEDPDDACRAVLVPPQR